MTSKKTQNVTKHKKSKFDEKKLKLEIWHNLKPHKITKLKYNQNVTKLKKTLLQNLLAKIVKKKKTQQLKMWQKTQKLKFRQNSKT